MNFPSGLRSQALAGLLLIAVVLLAGFAVALSPTASAAWRQVANFAARTQPQNGDFAEPISSTVNYEGLLREGSGAPLSGSYTLTVKTYETADPSFTLAGWEDTFTNVTVRDGHFKVVLGSQNPLGSAFSNSPLFLGVSVQGLNGEAEFSPRQEFYPVPWSVFASRVEQANSAGSARRALFGEDATLSEFATTADYLVTFTPTVYAVNAWGQSSNKTVEVTAFKNHPEGTMCMLTAVQVEVQLRAPNCRFDQATSILMAGGQSKCELTCFTFDEYD